MLSSSNCNSAEQKLSNQELILKKARWILSAIKISKLQYQTKIAVAGSSAYRGTEDKDANMNGIPDPMEIAKDATEQ